jgi:hypothetical protein
MKKVEYYRGYANFIELEKGTFLESFIIKDVPFIAVQNKKEIEILYKNLAVYNTFGRKNYTLQDLKNSLASNAEKTENFLSYLNNYVDPYFLKPVKEKPVKEKPVIEYVSYKTTLLNEIKTKRQKVENHFKIGDIEFIETKTNIIYHGFSVKGFFTILPSLFLL